SVPSGEWLRGKERLKDSRLCCLFDPKTRVADRQHDVWTRECARVQSSIRCIEFNVRRFNCERAASWHCIPRVDCQIRDDLYESSAAGAHQAQSRTGIESYRDVLADQTLHQFLGILHYGVQV